MRNVQKISAVALGMLAGFAINKYATAENFAKLKGKIKETYDDLSKKFEEATEPKVEYVDDEIVVDGELLDSCDRMVLRCKPNYAASLYDHIPRVIKTKGYITINDIVDLGWLADDTIDEITRKYTVEECYLMGWRDNYDCGYSAGQDYMFISYPEEIMVDMDEYTEFMDDDEYEVRQRHEDILNFTVKEFKELGTDSRSDQLKIFADLSDKFYEDHFVSVATLMQVIYDVENVSEASRSFKERFTELTKNYDEDTLINYGWQNFYEFDLDNAGSDIDDVYRIARSKPHNITQLVEEWTKKNHKEFKEETKAE